MYLTRDQLAEWLGVKPSSYLAMTRRLDALGVPYSHLPGQCPRVLKSVHDALLRGEKVEAVATEGPRFDFLFQRAS